MPAPLPTRPPAPEPAAQGPSPWRDGGTSPRGVGRTVLGGALAVATAGALAGCASAVEVPAAPFADDPVCARVVLALPDVLAEAERTDTTSQATAAWTAGEPREAIVLRCGVEPLPPTTEQCVTVADDRGRSVDWVAVPGDESTRTPWTFTTYGRVPAVEVTVPTTVPPEASQSFLVDLGEAVSHAEQLRGCL